MALLLQMCPDLRIRDKGLQTLSVNFHFYTPVCFINFVWQWLWLITQLGVHVRSAAFMQWAFINIYLAIRINCLKAALQAESL
jgi:hypothetical protein